MIFGEKSYLKRKRGLARQAPSIKTAIPNTLSIRLRTDCYSVWHRLQRHQTKFDSNAVPACGIESEYYVIEAVLTLTALID